jgi:hypothetical protein
MLRATEYLGLTATLDRECGILIWTGVPHEQEHYSLMGEFLDRDLSESQQIEELLRHADKELSVTVRLHAADAFKRASGNLQRVFLLKRCADSDARCS